MGSTPILQSVGNSTYHALQTTIERRYQKGLTVLANFQFSKSIDDSSANKQNGNVRTNPADQRFDKGPADFYRKYVFNLSGLYELPIHPAKPLTRALIGGWNLNVITSVNTGQPFTVTSGVDNALTARVDSAQTWWAIPISRRPKPPVDHLAVFEHCQFRRQCHRTYGVLDATRSSVRDSRIWTSAL